MEALLQRHVIGFPIGSSVQRLLPDLAGHYNIPSPDSKYPTLKQCSKDSMLSRVNKLGKRADSFAHGVREHGEFVGLVS
ncbi:hypothetical protein SDJN02_21718 [Cucurbita argyrosperma subsp. argyrosperma]|nr:hypothetical protein SDJN02_21718 [Cucurbita argyrosperma subsp. argyrosperma]